MRSTGEVMGSGQSFGEAYAKAQLAAGNKLPSSGTVLMSVRDADKAAAVEIADYLIGRGFDIMATRGTRNALREAGLECSFAYKVIENQRPNVVDYIEDGTINLVINTTAASQAIADSRTIRCSAIQNRVCYSTTMSGARAIVDAMESGEPRIYSL